MRARNTRYRRRSSRYGRRDRGPRRERSAGAPNVPFAAVCGAIVGGLSAASLAGVLVGFQDTYTPFDQWFADYWNMVLLIAGLPVGIIGGAAFFALVHGAGGVRLSTLVGFAAGNIVGAFIGLPAFLSTDFGFARGFLTMLWNWATGLVLVVVEKPVEWLFRRAD